MATAVIGALRVNLGIDTAQFTSGLNQATRNLDRVGKQLKSIGTQLSVAVTAPLTLLGRSIIKTSAAFEQGMADVGAVLRPAAWEMERLTKVAEELGRTTKFTAAQAASGMEMLARNGLDTTNILRGATKATLDLAAAAGSELAPAADAITDIMVNFRKSGADLKPVIDQVTGTLVSSKLGWEDYRLALGQAAGAAGPLGMSFEDMNAALAATASSFSSGVEAGTSLKGFLLKLAPSSKQNKEVMKELGLEFFDAAGNMKSLAEISQVLQDRLGGLTKQAQTEVLGQLFGQRVIRTALRLMEEGAEGIQRFRTMIGTGDAEEMAAKRIDTLEGALVLLQSAWEGLSIAIGKSGLKEWARNFVDRMTEVVRSLSEAHPALLRFVTVFAGLTAVLGPVLLTLGVLATAIAAISLPITGVIAAITAVSIAVALWGDDLERIGKTIEIIFSDIYNSAKEWLVDKFGWVIDGVTALVNRMIEAFRWLADKLGLTALANTLKKEFNATAQRLNNDFTMIKEIGTGAAEIVSDAWARAGGRMESVAEEARGAWARMAQELVLSRPLPVTAKPVLSGDGTTDTSAHDDTNRLLKGFQSSQDSARQRVEDARIEAESFGMTAAAAAQYRTEQELLRDAVEAGLPLTSELIDKNRLIAESMGGITARLEGLQVMEQIRTPAEALRIEMQNLDDLLQRGALSWEDYQRAAQMAAENAGVSWKQTSSSIAGAIETFSGAFGESSKKMTKINQASGIANAIISTHVGIAKALELPFPANLAAAAVVAARGFASVAAIRSQSKASGSFSSAAVSSSSMGSERSPGGSQQGEFKSSQQAVGITVVGSRLSKEDVRSMIEDMNAAIKDGAGEFVLLGA